MGAIALYILSSGTHLNLTCGCSPEPMHVQWPRRRDELLSDLSGPRLIACSTFQELPAKQTRPRVYWYICCSAGILALCARLLYPPSRYASPFSMVVLVEIPAHSSCLSAVRLMRSLATTNFEMSGGNAAKQNGTPDVIPKGGRRRTRYTTYRTLSCRGKGGGRPSGRKGRAPR